MGATQWFSLHWCSKLRKKLSFLTVEVLIQAIVLIFFTEKVLKEKRERVKKVHQ